MSVGFGFSVGDFIAAINLLREVATALKATGGAHDDFQKTVAKLEITKAILSWIASIKDGDGESASIHAIHNLASLIRDDVKSFVARIQAYEGTLGSRKTRRFGTGAVANIKWSQCMTGEVKKLYQEVDSKTASLNLLFSLHLSKVAWSGREELASARKAILHAINDHAAVPPIQVPPTPVNALVKQDIEDLATELKGLTVSHAKAANGMLSSMATKDDIRDLQILLRTQAQSGTPSQTSSTMSQDTSRLMLVLTIPRLHLPAREAWSVLEHFSAEVAILLEVFLVSFVLCLRDLLLALPQMILLYRVLRRLPQAVSLVLHDNITFEDALGRMQSLQFQQFRHWTVFEASLRCNFANLPGMQKVLSGQYVLTTPKHQLPLTPQNWSERISPGFVVKMAIMINTVQTNYQKCLRGCGSKVSKVTDVQYRCDACGMVIEVQMELPEFGSEGQDLDTVTRSPRHAFPVKGAPRRPRRPNPTSLLADIPKSSSDASKSNRAHTRPPPEQQASRRQTEFEELKVLKRVQLTGKDLVECQFGFLSSQFPTKSIAPHFPTSKAEPRLTQTNGLYTSDEWIQQDFPGEETPSTRGTDMPQLENRFPDSTPPTLDLPDPKGHDDSPSPHPAPVPKAEKRFICNGKLRFSPGTTWGCGGRYATINALSRHFYSETGQTCTKALVDDERQYFVKNLNEREIACLEMRDRALHQLPVSLLEQYPSLKAVEHGRLKKRNSRIPALPDHQVQQSLFEERNRGRTVEEIVLNIRNSGLPAILEYREQLMLLETQNKKRLAKARQEDFDMNNALASLPLG